MTTQHQTAAGRSPGLWWPGLRGRPWSAALAAAAVAVLAVAAADGDGPVLCPFRRCTGGYCPGCGLTRAGSQLARGQVAASWHHHPFALAAACQVAALGVWRLSTRRRPAILRLVPLVAANGAGLLGLWLVRLALGHIPVPFAG